MTYEIRNLSFVYCDYLHVAISGKTLHAYEFSTCIISILNDILWSSYEYRTNLFWLRDLTLKLSMQFPFRWSFIFGGDYRGLIIYYESIFLYLLENCIYETPSKRTIRLNETWIIVAFTRLVVYLKSK